MTVERNKRIAAVIIEEVLTNLEFSSDDLRAIVESNSSGPISEADLSDIQEFISAISCSLLAHLPQAVAKPIFS